MSSVVPKRLVLLLGLSIFLLACAPRYEYKAVPVKNITSYSNLTDVGTGSFAAEAFFDDRLITETFGYNLKKAGVIPVRILVENRGDTDVSVLPGSTVTDARGQTWELLPQDIVYQRIDAYTSGGVSGQEGIRRTATGAVVGGILGAAVGVATGTNVGSAAGTGAVIGGAVGASSAILGIGDTQDKSAAIVRDFSNLSLQQSVVAPDETVRGLLYFPGESDRPVKLNLKVKIGQNKSQNVVLPL
jgi:hypothetical protein